jgi:hypothetical protein
VPAIAAVSVTIFGHDFSQADSSATVGAGGMVCITSSWLASTALRCQIASLGIRAAYKAFSTSEAEGEASFILDAPLVSFLLPMNMPRSAIALSMTIAGLNFAAGLSDVRGATIGRFECGRGSLKWLSDTSAACSVPVDAVVARPSVSVIVDGQRSGSFNHTWKLDAPVLTSLSPVNAPVRCQGSLLTVSGVNLGIRPEDGHMEVCPPLGELVTASALRSLRFSWFVLPA